LQVNKKDITAIIVIPCKEIVNQTFIDEKGESGPALSFLIYLKKYI
jgi:hypothetical protein